MLMEFTTGGRIHKRKSGRKKFQETRHPIYKGVRKRNGKWVSELRQPNKKSSVWLGTFTHPDMAAIAYDVAALAFKGESASLNFPDTASALIPSLSSCNSTRDVQFAATEAAEKFSYQVKGTASSSSSSSSNSSSSNLSETSNEILVGEGSRSFYWDEEESFNMPGLLDSMAEGLIIAPPALEKGFSWVGLETTVDLTLWGD
ncbi:C-repeat binding factor [Quillaja saponaria]|uniref:C-repeat binding factor n=1 Tax=Quillaja saponaria TaxID=32244 RepID=A0AAD7PYH3_QUISA|nr:C-repeat binding factor [Quillaja saponaria]